MDIRGHCLLLQILRLKKKNLKTGLNGVGKMNVTCAVFIPANYKCDTFHKSDLFMRSVGCLSHNLEKNIFETITKSSRMAGKADISHDKNVSTGYNIVQN